jgi:hypothetical protein
VNGKDIYELKEKQPLMIGNTLPVTRIIITNGFHHSREISISLKPGTHFFEIESRLDDIQLLTGLLLVLFSFVIFIVTGVRLFMVFANLPILIFIWFYYFSRKNFIQIHRLSPGTPTDLK